MTTYGKSTPTCNEEAVFISNHHIHGNITNIHYYDNSAGAWSGNLLGAASPFAFLPPTPLQVGDLVVFGIDATALYSAPFSSLVFDIATAIGVGGGITIVWRYSQVAAGADPNAWPVLTVQDNTNADGLMTGDAFDTTGIKSVHWRRPSDWTNTLDPTIAAANIGVTGYYVCADITAAAGAPTPPTQQNRDVYAIQWPYIEVDEDDVGGDIPALSKIVFRNQSDKDQDISAIPELPADRIICGLRSLSRGVNFSAFINLADNCRNDITVTAPSAQAAFATSYLAPTTRYIAVTNKGAGFSTTLDAQALFDPSLSKEYYGTYRCFLWAMQTSGTAGNVEVKARYGFVDGLKQNSKTAVSLVNINTLELLDLGIITLPTGQGLSYDDYSDQLFVGLITSGNGADDINYYSMILIPTDEWSCDAIFPDDDECNLSKRGTTDNRILDIDSIGYPKVTIRSLLREYSTEYVRGNWQNINNGYAIVQAKSTQRLWVVAPWYESSSWWLEQYASHSVTMQKVQRYFSLRGDN